MSKHSVKSKRGFKTGSASGKPKYMRKPLTKPVPPQNMPKISAWQIFLWTVKFKVTNFISKVARRTINEDI